MIPDLDWERALRETSFDLPPERWQKLENDMRGWLAGEARKPSAPPSLLERLRTWSHRWGLAVGTGTAFAALCLGLWLRPGFVRTEPGRFTWAQGQVLDVHGHAAWDWADARVRLEGDDSRMVLTRRSEGTVAIRLERGQATFRVDHRRPDESFLVEAGQCRVHVVGTVFSVGIDSADSWVRVQEGRIRFERTADSRLVDAGMSAKCSEAPTGGTRPLAVQPPPARIERPAVATRHPAAPEVATAPQVEVPSCLEGSACIPVLSRFVREHGNHPAAPEVALRWARLSVRWGDARDALVAYSIAATSPALVDISRLESLKVRAERLSQDRIVSDSLDSWIPELAPGSGIWRSAWTLRGETARRTGDEAMVRRAEQILSKAASSQGGR